MHLGVELPEVVLRMMLEQSERQLLVGLVSLGDLRVIYPRINSHGSASCIAKRGSAFVVKLSLCEAFSLLVS